MVPTHSQFGSPLSLAVEIDDSKLIHLLLDAGADVDLPITSGRFGSVLVLAAFNGNFAVARLLLKAGADVNLVLYHGEFGNALMAALYAQNGKMVEYLLEYKADVNKILPSQSSSPTALIAASSMNRVDLLRILLHAGAHVNLQAEYHAIHANALVSAARLGHVDIVEALIRAGAKVNLQIKSGRHEYGTALVAACCSTRVDSVKRLLDAGANPNLQTKKGEYESPLVAACCNTAFPEFVSILLEARADPNLPLIYGTYGNAISAAINKGNRGAIDTLLKAGASLEPLSETLLISQISHDSGYSIPEPIERTFVSEVQEMEQTYFKYRTDRLWNRVAVIKQHDVMKLTTLCDWLGSVDSGLFLLDKVTRALQSRSQFYGKFTPCCLDSCLTQSIDNVIFSGRKAKHSTSSKSNHHPDYRSQ
ncbi:hypothetical protein N7493_009249 [Penicillium malachiteum]|uniref:Uncharacterized protein n=1 Tax=Penicillium malachiteum TaxID=1324776 RepID=A0AAD6HG89_9EURO|nr:hypothetical protein N7493_009249 [Penicillium malachiteum]